jgi:DNA ligase-1
MITSGSGSRYDVKNVGGVYSCSCPGWRNQSRHPHYRTCKHLVEFRGARDEAERIALGGRGGHPATVERLVAPYWPVSGAGRAADIASGRIHPADLPEVRGAPDPLFGPRGTVGGGAMRHAATTRTRLPAKKAEPVKAPAKPHNAWSAILDDDHPLAEPLPAAVPMNDTGAALAARDDEPEWKADTSSSPPPSLDPASVIDPARVLAGGSAVVRSGFRGVLLAESWNGFQDITGWQMSEKLDGIRAYWDGTQFYSRNGNTFAVPAWFREKFPKDMHLDGEFWMGRGRFQETSGFVRRADAGEHWRRIFYMMFDAPSVEAGFEDRLAAIGKLDLPAWAKLLPHAACPSLDALRMYLAAVEEQGGEGVMLRQPMSRYYRVRSTTLLKVKTFFDTEVEVTGYTAGKGRHSGAVGALEVIVRETITLTAGKKKCTLKGGTEFEVGTGLSDDQRQPGRIPIGALVTVRFQELSKDGIPRFPSLIGVRDYE